MTQDTGHRIIETSMTKEQLGKAHVALRNSYSMLWQSPAFIECSEKQKEQIDVGLKTCLKLIDEKTKEQAPNNNRTTEQAGTRTFKTIEENEPCVIIHYHSGTIEVYLKDSKELLETLIHNHEYIDHIEEAVLKQ